MSTPKTPLPNTPVQPFSPEDLARRKRRSAAMAIGLVLLVVLFFVTTLVKLGSGIMERTM
jgi:hypothetical protein